MTTVQRRRRTKPLCPVIAITTVQKIRTRTTTATNRREGNIKDYKVLDDDEDEEEDEEEDEDNNEYLRYDFVVDSGAEEEEDESSMPRSDYKWTENI